jgi:hypothetical protein
MEQQVKSRISEMKNSLRAYLKTYRSEYLLAIKEYLREISESSGLKMMGCEEKCAGCFLGHEKLPEALNPCRMWALYEALEGIEIRETKNPRIITLSKELLEALDGNSK